MFNLTDEQRAALKPISEKLVPNALLLREAGEAVDTAATPFSRSLLAALLSGVSSTMAETMIVAAYGSPKSPATGKPVKGVSGLRAIHGGMAAYQTFKTVNGIAAAMGDPTDYQGADIASYLVEGVTAITVGEIVSPMVEAFAIGGKDAVKSLNALSVAVKAIMTAHAKAVAEAADAPPAASNDDVLPETEAAPLGDRLAALLGEVTALDDDGFIEHSTALAGLADYITARWDAIEAATDTETVEAKAA